MVRNAFTRAQNHTSRTMSIADAVNVPTQEPAPAARQETRRKPASVEAQPAVKMRRTSIQLENETYVALKAAAAEHQVPLWAVLNEAVRSSLMEERPFDWWRAADVANAANSR